MCFIVTVTRSTLNQYTGNMKKENLNRKKKPVKYPGIGRAAKQLGRSREHIFHVLEGRRASPHEFLFREVVAECGQIKRTQPTTKRGKKV
jgi:hypothetical protein